MIHLREITLREIHLPLVEAFQTAAGTVAERRILLLELHDGDGTTSWSECVAEARPSYSPETVDTCWLAIIEWLAPRVLALPIQHPSQVHDLLSRDIRGHQMARAALEMATWALGAAHRGLPLAELLTMESPVARDRKAQPRALVDTGIVLGMEDTVEEVIERAQESLDAGYRRIKVKIEPGRDYVLLKALRQALGPGASLSADANCSYSMANAAHRKALTALDRLDLSMIEQPLGADELANHAELQRTLKTPICLDESITSLTRAQEMLTLGSARMVNVKPGRVGGFREAIAIHDLCARADIPVWCGGMLECGIGRAYNVALASLPGFTEPGDLSPSARYWTRDVVTPEWTMDDAGHVSVPLERPGLGVDVDTAMIDDLTVRSETLRAR